MQDMEKVVEFLEYLKSIVAHDGKWININELAKISGQVYSVLDNAREAQAHMNELIFAVTEQEKIEFERKMTA